MKKTVATALILCLTVGAVHAHSLLRKTVIEFYAVSHAVQDAIEFDTCHKHGGGARTEWLSPRQRRAYDRVSNKLLAAYRADPRDGAVEQVEKDFCKAAISRRH